MLLAPGLPGALYFKLQKIQILKFQKIKKYIFGCRQMYTLRILLIFHIKYLVVQAQEKRQVRQILKEKKATLLMLPDLDFVLFVEERVQDISYCNFEQE
jgi:hypothetical protein